MSGREQAYKTIVEELESRQWRYDVDPENGVIHFGVNLSIVGVQVFIALRDSDFMVSADIPLCARPEQYGAMVALLNRINCRLLVGNFELNENNGRVSVRTFVSFEDAPLSTMTARKNINTPLELIEKYCEPLAMILTDAGSIEEALRLVN